ncbi:helix-hairpin-helix domain-containing protein [Streptomyces xanthophaeus]|uniref:helix-hairpin-helix domain-containing protein n=1 Tax=Streptomyces xanthophaeus TaxID=67385 RepID=UPI002647013D|nr:helix-hairpin-helix domain-containing protein [Streptomyces xanthophaeus]WKD34707.1 helix-hairpin-helix domain-containing protein [Streptomyces xanthophaeus]
MTLRTRASYPSGATGGPGRPRLSDGRLSENRLSGSRLRYRRSARRGRRVPHPEPGAVRRRAEALLGGSSPPQAPVPPPPPQAPPPRALQAPPAAPDGADARAPSDGASGLPPGAARRLAVRERLPLWLQDRCEVRPRAVAAVGVVLIAAVGFAGQQYWSARPRAVTVPAVVAPGAVPAGATAPAGAPGPGAGAGAGGAARIVVDVSGKVRDPGVRRLPAGSRVEDALAAAGGVRPGTDTTGLNRARVLVDGEQVVVGAPAQPPPAAGPGGGAGSGPGSGPGPGPLSLGSATVAQLDGLPGVGPVLAQHIVDFRTARGGFRSVEELRQVDGIGERRFADLRTLVRP